MLAKIKNIFSDTLQSNRQNLAIAETKNADSETLGEKMIISIHLPKTAGTSFAAALETHFGTKLLKDTNGGLGYDISDGTLLSLYEKYKLTLEASLRVVEMDFSKIECIHGHSYAIKYLLMKQKRDVKFVTWMRNPVDRVISQYHFWMNLGGAPTSALHQKVLGEKWSLERFCLGSELRNIYWEMLWGFPLEYFDFIGVTEFYEEDFNYFARHYLDTSMDAQMLNASNNRGRPYQIDSSLRREIEAFHDQDMHLYQKALEMRLTRCSKGSDSVDAPNRQPLRG